LPYASVSEHAAGAAAAPRLGSGRSSLKSVHWTDLTGKPVVPHSFAFGEPL